MDALGYRRFAVVGFDTGMPVALSWRPITPSVSIV
jgi:hypothetical protein